MIAKKFYGKGCLAYRCKTAEEARLLPERLKNLQGEGLQIVVLNSPEIYSEYAPYTYVEDMDDFLLRVSRLGRNVPTTSQISTHGYFSQGDNASTNKSSGLRA